MFPQIWMKSAVFERQQGRIDAALETVKAALVKFPKFPKLYMIQGQIYQSQKNYSGARAVYAAGLKQCPKDVNLWISASRLEELDGKSIKARALLERARMVNPASEQLWAEAVGVEERSGSATQAKAVLSRGNQTYQCVSTSGVSLYICFRSARMSRVGPLMDFVCLVRTSTDQEDTLCGCPPKNKRQPIGDLHSREDLLV